MMKSNIGGTPAMNSDKSEPPPDLQKAQQVMFLLG